MFFLQGFVEFRYNLGSGPAILRSLRKVTFDQLAIIEPSVDGSHMSYSTGQGRAMKYNHPHHVIVA